MTISITTISSLIKFSDTIYTYLGKFGIIKFVDIKVAPKIESISARTKTIAIIKERDYKLPKLKIDVSITPSKNLSKYLEKKKWNISIKFLLDNVDLFIDNYNDNGIVIDSLNSRSPNESKKEHELIIEEDKNYFEKVKNAGLNLLINIYDHNGNIKKHHPFLKVNAYLRLEDILTKDIAIILINPDK